MSKTWYEVRVTCKRQPGMSGDLHNELLAKVKSEGLAQIVKQKFQEIYGKEAVIKVC